MRRGLLLSLMLHMAVFFFLWAGVVDLFPEEVKTIKVHMMSGAPKKVVKPEKPEPVNTQQSPAPPEPPPPAEVPHTQPTEKPDATVAPTPKAAQEKKPEQKKVEPKPTPPAPKPQPVPPQKETAKDSKTKERPEKLDKTKDKKNIIKDKNAQYKEPKEEDFLKALDFAEQLKNKPAAPIDMESDEMPTLTDADLAELAAIKQLIESNWYKPAGMRGGYIVQIRVEVKQDGTVKNLKVLKTSGQRFLDDSLVRAVRKSSPLPIPQEKYETFRVIDLYWDDTKHN